MFVALILTFTLNLVFVNTVGAAQKVNISVSNHTIEVGQSIDLKFNYDVNKYELFFNVVANNKNVSLNNTSYYQGANIKAKGEKPGKTTFTIKGTDGVGVNGDDIFDALAQGSFTITVVEKSASKPKTNTPKPPQLDNTEEEKKTAEELEKEELEKRMKTPLIKEIDVISNSERLKGKSLLSFKPESQKFEYSGDLPRNIDKINLKINTIKDDVKLDYPQNITIDKGKDSVEFVIKATQDKLVQEFKIELKTPEKSSFQIKDGTRKLELLVDPYLDTAMEELGFEKGFINKEEPSKGFYYTMDKNNYIIAADEENNGYVYLLDEKNNPVQEVFLVSNKDNKVSMLVNKTLEEGDERLLNENSYNEHEITISKLLTDIDPTIQFNNKINGWLYDEEAIITHGLVSNDETELVYMDSLSNVKSAFVKFDEVEEISTDLIKYGGYGLWIITLIIFLIYGFRSRGKLKSKGRH